ncbi:cytochrome c biogenesis protein CcdA [Pantanalinema rosaneae CENA516]|uniref:cytochrome c biogenesis protein CcdA n=1 Tax=Pantanalinema rosaneae TaxID=1620701 RepID=UPI003D701568
MTRTKLPSQPLSVRYLIKFLLPFLLFCGGLFAVWLVNLISQSSLYQFVEQFSFWANESYQGWFSQQQQSAASNPILLVSLAFAGGVIASVSPCILSMLPINLSYIGTREITSRRDAWLKASLFVLGVVTVLSLLGLVSSLAGIVFREYKGYFHVAVGSLIILMGLSLAGIVQLPNLPSRWQMAATNAPPSDRKASRSLGGVLRSMFIGPYGIGLTFALVSSPCTSPIVVTVLSAGAATGSQLQSTLAMISYALGYTAIIFFASLFTGLAKQTRTLLIHSDKIVRVASVMLLLVGGFYLITGGQWIWATITLG